MMIRSDPKFRSEYNFDQDAQVALPSVPKHTPNVVPADEEFNRLMNTSKYSIGSASHRSPERHLISEKSSVVNAPQPKYTNLHNNSEDKLSNRNQRSRERLYKAGGSIISNESGMYK